MLSQGQEDRTFAVICRENRWSRFGHPVDVREAEVFETSDLKAAFERARDERRKAGPGATYAPSAVQFWVVDETGARIDLDALYEQVVGPLTFAALCAIPAVENWSINLDDWLDAGASR